jgi:hypothetical protein
MLFTFFEITILSENLIDIHNQLIKKQSGIFQLLNEKENFIIINFPQSEYSNCIITKFDNQAYILVNTFDKSKIAELESFFSSNFQISFNSIKIATDSFKKILKFNYPIIELDAICHEPIFEEISISGTDIRNNELFQLTIENCEIQKLVIYIDSIGSEKRGGVVKIFFDGKFSIIPEFKFDIIPYLFTQLLKELEIA